MNENESSHSTSESYKTKLKLAIRWDSLF